MMIRSRRFKALRSCARLTPAIAGALFLTTHAGAADFDVTRTDDPVPDGCVSGVDCSLREAVIDANAADGADRVLLPAGVYTLTIAGNLEDLGATGDLDCDSSDLEIRGLGATPADTAIDATGLGDRILEALPSCSVRLLDLTLRGGSADLGGAIRSDQELTIRRVVFDQNVATTDGGAIYSFGTTARVTIEDSAFTDNRAITNGGAIFNQDESTVVAVRTAFTANVAENRGGAIYHQNEGAFTLDDCLLENNRAEVGNSDGGAIFTQNSSSFTIVRSLLTGNIAEEAGGAIFQQNDSALTIIETTIRANRALGTGESDGGGGIYLNNDSALVIERSTISGNESSGDAGGISRNNDGQLLLRNSTVTGNTAGGNGGGLVFDSAGGSGFIAIENSTVAGNTATGLGGGVYHEGDPLLEAGFVSTILADNVAGGVPNDCDTDGLGVFTSHGFNVDSTDTCGLVAATDQPAALAMLGPLADNGGPTETRALLDGSDAIDAGSPDPLGPAIDQRGVARPQGAAPDVGAFEAEAEVEVAEESLCALPGATAEDWKANVPTGGCADQAEAERVCKAWLATCKNLVKATTKCLIAELSGGAKLDKALCKTAAVPDLNTCKSDVGAALSAAKADAKAQKAAATTVCEDSLDECVDECID